MDFMLSFVNKYVILLIVRVCYKKFMGGNIDERM